MIGLVIKLMIITKLSNNSQQNDSEIATNEHDKEIPKENIYLQKKDKKYWWIEINI